MNNNYKRVFNIFDKIEHDLEQQTEVCFDYKDQDHGIIEID